MQRVCTGAQPVAYPRAFRLGALAESLRACNYKIDLFFYDYRYDLQVELHYHIGRVASS